MSWLCARCRTRFEEPTTRCPHDGRRVVEDLSGETVGGRYALRELLGIGGMDSSVWLAWQTSTQRAVAVKLLPATDDAASERFARGARIASNLNHPNITVVHDYGRTDDKKRLYLVMELLEGQVLHRVLRQGPLGVERAVHVTDQLLRALDHAHRKHVVHRDIKPGNLFLCTKNDDPDFIKVMDFGIARFTDDAEEASSDDLEITQARQICGTPQYMAPEQVSFGHVDARTDLYATGIVLYRMLTGRLPFQGSSHHELFRHHLHTQPPPFSQTRPDLECPRELEALVMRSLAKEPDDRFASAAEMRKALRQIRRRMGYSLSPDTEDSMTTGSDATAWSVEAPTETPDRPRRGVWLVALLLLFLLGGAGVWLLQRPGDETPAGVAVDDRAPAVATVAPTPAPPPDAASALDAGAVDAAPQLARVALRSEPDGAEVRRGEEVLGRTPLDLELAPGRHVLEVHREGHEPERVELDLGPGQDAVSHLARLKAKPKRRTWKPRPRAADEPKKPAPAEAPPEPAQAAAEPQPKQGSKVRMQLLDESGSRAFEVRDDAKQPARPADDAPSPTIQLLD